MKMRNFCCCFTKLLCHKYANLDKLENQHPHTIVQGVLGRIAGVGWGVGGLGGIIMNFVYFVIFFFIRMKTQTPEKSIVTICKNS